MADLEGSDGKRKEFYVVGKSKLPGKLSYSIGTGRAKFGIDLAVPDMLHAKFLRSPYANAVVKSVDLAMQETVQTASAIRSQQPIWSFAQLQMPSISGSIRRQRRMRF